MMILGTSRVSGSRKFIPYISYTFLSAPTLSSSEANMFDAPSHQFSKWQHVRVSE